MSVILLHEGLEQQGWAAMADLTLSYCASVSKICVQSNEVLRKGPKYVKELCRALSQNHFFQVYKCCYPVQDNPSDLTPEHPDCRTLVLILQLLQHPDPRCVFAALIMGIHHSFGNKFYIEKYEDILRLVLNTVDKTENTIVDDNKMDKKIDCKGEKGEKGERVEKVEIRLHYALTRDELIALFEKELQHSCTRVTATDPILTTTAFEVPDPTESDPENKELAKELAKEPHREPTCDEVRELYIGHLVRGIKLTCRDFLREFWSHQGSAEIKELLRLKIYRYLNHEWESYCAKHLSTTCKEDSKTQNRDEDGLAQCVKGIRHESPVCVFEAVCKGLRRALLGSLKWENSKTDENKKVPHKVHLSCPDAEIEQIIRGTLAHHCIGPKGKELNKLINTPLFEEEAPSNIPPWFTFKTWSRNLPS